MTWPYYLTLILGQVEQEYFSNDDAPTERDPYEQAALEHDFMAVLRGDIPSDPSISIETRSVG